MVQSVVTWEGNNLIKFKPGLIIITNNLTKALNKAKGLGLAVYAKTAGPRTEQGRNIKGPTACSFLSDQMSDINILSTVNVIIN